MPIQYWDLTTALEQRSKRQQLKAKHSSLHRLVREGNLATSQDENATTSMLPSEQSNHSPISESKSHKQISKTLRKLLKTPTIKEDIVRYKPGQQNSFRYFEEEGIWRSDTSILDKPLEPSGSGSDVNNNVASRTESSTSQSGCSTFNENHYVEAYRSTTSASYETDDQNKQNWKDKLYIWWLKNVAIRMRNKNLDKKSIGQNQNGNETFLNSNQPSLKSKTVNSLNADTFRKIVVSIFLLFFIVMICKTLFMFMVSQNKILNQRLMQIFLSVQNGFVALMCFAYFISLNPNAKIQLEICPTFVVPVSFALMSLGSSLNYGYFMHRQNCFFNSVHIELECEWSYELHKWFDVLMTVGSVLNLLCYYSHLKQSSDNLSNEV